MQDEKKIRVKRANRLVRKENQLKKATQKQNTPFRGGLLNAYNSK